MPLEYNVGRRGHFNAISHLSGVSLLITSWFPLKTESLHLLTGISVRLRFLHQSLFISLPVEVIQWPPHPPLWKSSSLYCLPQLTHLMRWFSFKRTWTVALVHVSKCFYKRHCDILGNFGAQCLWISLYTQLEDLCVSICIYWMKVKDFHIFPLLGCTPYFVTRNLVARNLALFNDVLIIIKYLNKWYFVIIIQTCFTANIV